MKTELNPYAEIEKVPLFASDRMRSRGYSVRLEDAARPSGWSEVGVVSADYLLVPNREVRAIAEEIARRSGEAWHETRTFFDGKRYAYALTTRSETLHAEVREGDYVGLGMFFENSYDGSRKLAVSLYVNRVVCSNGLIAPKHFAQMRFKHDASGQGWEEEVRRALALVDTGRGSLASFARAAERMAKKPLGTEELAELRSEYLRRLPVTLWGKIMDRYLLEEEPTAWGLLNAGTNVTWHNENSSAQDFVHNEVVVSGLLDYADTFVN